MLNSKVYLDHAAAELPVFEVQQYVKDALYLAYNPSAMYETGVRNRQIIDHVREQIAQEIHCSPEEIYFTSGCTEANVWAIDGFKKAHPQSSVISTTIEHSSIDDNPNIEKLITVDQDGFIDLNNLKEVYEEVWEPESTLWVVQHANNVIGCVQDLRKVRKILNKGYLFVDAAQTFGKLPINVKAMKIDMLSASARKIGGLGGVGFLYINKDLQIDPLFYGAQENHMRGGTYNEIGIGTLGVALDELDRKNNLVIKSRRNFLIDELLKLKGVSLIGKRSDRLPGTVLIKIDGLSVGSQALVGILDTHGFMVSTDSACHAGEAVFSHVLEAIGYTPETAKTVLRISIGIENSVDQLQEFVKCLRGIIRMFRE